MPRKSIVTNRNLYSALHRFAYSQGWAPVGAFAVVGGLALPIAPYPSLYLLLLCLALAAFTGWTEFLENGMKSLRKAAKRREREERNLSIEERFNRYRQDID